MVKIKITVLIAAFFLLHMAVYAKSSKTAKDPTLLGQTTTKNFTKIIPIHWSGGLPLVDVEINGKKYKFLFDTAAPTIVPYTIVNDLTPLNANINLHDSAGKQKLTHLYTLSSLKLGTIEFKNYTVLTQDFSKSFPISCLGFDGIFGYTMFRGLNIKLDLANNQIIISDKQISHNNYIEVPINFTFNSGPRIVLTFPFGDGVFEIDTGKNKGITLGDTSIVALLEKEKYPSRAIWGTFFSSLSGASKNTKAFEYVVKDFSIAGKLKIKSFPFTIDDSRAFLIGNTFLRYFSIILDLPNQKAYFRQTSNNRLSESFRHTYGITPFWSKEKGLFVSAITEKTPISKSHVKLGDIILRLNNLDTSNMKRDDFCRLIADPQNSNTSFETKETLTLTVKHDNNISVIKLKK